MGGTGNPSGSGAWGGEIYLTGKVAARGEPCGYMEGGGNPFSGIFFGITDLIATELVLC